MPVAALAVTGTAAAVAEMLRKEKESENEPITKSQEVDQVPEHADKEMVDEYTTGFEMLVLQAGYGPAETLRHYKWGLNPEIRQKLIDNVVDKTLDAWKECARAVNRNN